MLLLLLDVRLQPLLLNDQRCLRCYLRCYPLVQREVLPRRHVARLLFCVSPPSGSVSDRRNSTGTRQGRGVNNVPIFSLHQQQLKNEAESPRLEAC